MGTISLEGLEFFAYHGYYPEEQRIGNKYALDITIATDFIKAAQEDKLSETVNYETIYQIASIVMKEPAKLLEHIGFNVIEKIREKYPLVATITVRVSKFNPPVGGVCTRAVITMEG
ncbi:Dihydroneopterin aldolase [Dyadobacter sp. CECT 9623]|uniref:7,8-dihydroneopterin aldolase n=1 Tax=Dyadobacter linearis TaxID=2823330 RepID=A0ABN7R9G1_9BACT|nr:dihydroneopterin aldolase [Dyadobacter sp. CECT 9623]CAG5071255.1 Dihydroneopterin aldolase [Dyadobacter sp. CECT 9623]